VSSDPEASVCPSGEKAIVETGFSCPLREVFSFPSSGFQRWISLPADEAIQRPSRDHASARTASFEPR
jgi:hypothetical protein